MSLDLAAAARTARPLTFALGQQDDTRDARIEFAAAYIHAVREGVTLYWGQTRSRGHVGFTTLAELVAIDEPVRAAGGRPGAAGVDHRRIDADGTVTAVDRDGVETAVRARVMDSLAATLAERA